LRRVAIGDIMFLLTVLERFVIIRIGLNFDNLTEKYERKLRLLTNGNLKSLLLKGEKLCLYRNENRCLSA